MFRRLLLLPAGLLAAGMLIPPAQGRPDETFGTLRTTPVAPKAPASGTPLPRGAVPDYDGYGGNDLPQGVEPDSRPAPVHNPFPISPAVGPWVVCAAHYAGPDGFELARQVTTILREKHRMQAYIFSHGDEERRKQDAEWDALKQRYPGAQLRRRMYRIEEQYAVLIGGFKDFAAATAALPRVRHLPMPTLSLKSGRTAYEYLHYTEPTPDKRGMVTKKSAVNPFTQALVVRNPTSPPEATAKPKWDPFWQKLNEAEDYSLLRNPKKYTLLVKQYAGASSIQTSGSTPAASKSSGGGLLGMIGLGARQITPLEASAAQAHELAKFLRNPQFGFETYVLHTRTGSLVAVGGFEGPNDPAVNAVIRRLNSIQFNGGAKGADPIGLLPMPQMIEVPRF
jgi:hypothetical protein